MFTFADCTQGRPCGLTCPIRLNGTQPNKHPKVNLPLFPQTDFVAVQIDFERPLRGYEIGNPNVRSGSPAGMRVRL